MLQGARNRSPEANGSALFPNHGGLTMRQPTKFILVSTLAILTSVGCGEGPSQFEASGPEGPQRALPVGAEAIDFEGLLPGTIVSTVFGSLGSGPIGVVGTNPLLSGGKNAAVVFDTSNPTGGDFDLGTPNEACGGPGVGGDVGPGTTYENCTALGNVVIIAANLVDSNGDLLVDNPDDIDVTALNGVTVAFDFSALGSVTAHSITFVDVDGNGPDPRVELYDDAGNLLDSFPIPNDMPDNGVATVDLDGVAGVVTMLVWLNGSGGFENIVFSQEIGGTACRVTGGGVDTDASWDGTMANAKNGRGSEVNRYQFGGQAGAPTASQPQPHGEWTHHQQRGPAGSFVFHAGTSSAPEGTEIALIECSDPGFCFPARPAPAKQIDFEGVGSFKNVHDPSDALDGVIVGETLHFFRVHIEDLGEPGRNGRQDPPDSECPESGSSGGVAPCSCPDFYRITIYKEFLPGEPPNTADAIYEVDGYITGGNLQIHPPIN